jgi:hypothetical protein
MEWKHDFKSNWFELGENATVKHECFCPYTIDSFSLSWLCSRSVLFRDEGLNNTVSGIAVGQIAGRSGVHPDISPSEVSRQWQAKIPQGEKYEEV